MLPEMPTVLTQSVVLATGGVVIFMVALRLARGRSLSARYAVGWMGLGVLVVLAAACLPLVGRIGSVAEMTPTAVLLMMSTLVLLAISIQLSISVSQLQARVRVLAEAHALLAHEAQASRPPHA